MNGITRTSASRTPANHDAYPNSRAFPPDLSSSLLGRFAFHNAPFANGPNRAPARATIGGRRSRRRARSWYGRNAERSRHRLDGGSAPIAVLPEQPRREPSGPKPSRSDLQILRRVNLERQNGSHPVAPPSLARVPVSPVPRGQRYYEGTTTSRLRIPGRLSVSPGEGPACEDLAKHLCVSETGTITSHLPHPRTVSRFAPWTSSRSWCWRP